MMFEFIVQIILVISFGGMVLIAVHKVPVLRTLRAVVLKEPREKRRFFKRIKSANPIGKAILASKAFHKEAKKSKKDKEKKGGEVDFSEDYWGKIRGG